MSRLPRAVRARTLTCAASPRGSADLEHGGPMAGMFARSTTIHGDPAAVDDGIAFVHDESMPLLRAMEGCVGLSMLADRTSGHCIVTTSWRDEAALRSSEDGGGPSPRRRGEILGGRPELQDWEIAAMHRVHEAHHGAASRVTWLRTD